MPSVPFESPKVYRVGIEVIGERFESVVEREGSESVNTKLRKMNRQR